MTGFLFSIYDSYAQDCLVVFDNPKIELTSLEKQMAPKEGRIYIAFESVFQNDFVEMKVDNIVILNELISTDNTISLAKFKEIFVPKFSIEFLINKKIYIKLNKNKLRGYKNIYLNKVNDTIHVLVTNKPHFYK